MWLCNLKFGPLRGPKQIIREGYMAAVNIQSAFIELSKK